MGDKSFRRREPLPDNHWLELLSMIECQGYASIGMDCYRISLRIARVLRAACESTRRRRELALAARDDAATDEEASALWFRHVEHQRLIFRHTLHVVAWLIGLRMGLILAVKSGYFQNGAQELVFARALAEFMRTELEPPEAVKHIIKRLEAAQEAWVHKKNPSLTVYELSGGVAYRAIAMARAKGSEAYEFIAKQVELRQFARDARRGL